jgi:ribosomal protein S27E
MEPNVDLKPVSQELSCKDCGAILKFAPGSNSLHCNYCGGMNEIKNSGASIEELNFESFITEGIKTQEKQELNTVKCSGCGASTTMKPNVTSDDCPFCGTSLVLTSSGITSSLKPKSLLPFKIDKKVAFESFSQWIKKLWFAPSALKKAALNIDKLNGMYIPYWTYDCGTDTSYTGERGIDYQRTESYSVTVNGRSEQRERTVTVTDWSYVSGNVSCDFDDVLVNASNSLPKDYAQKLEPWDLQSLVPFDEKYLSGFRTESYQVGLKDGFETAKKIMEGPIADHIRKHIGGDHQRIHSADTSYQRITFKHTLLPIWISSYRFSGKVYRFLINGRTGEVQGERPYSWIKISLAVIGGLLLAGMVYMLVK